MDGAETDVTDGSRAGDRHAGCPIRRGSSNGSSLDGRWSERVWSTGAYRNIAPNYRSIGARLVDRTAVGPGDDVLDVGCGTGTVAVTVARRGGRVTGLDVAPSMLERARRNAAIAGLDRIAFRVGDATALPFGADAFDVTLSNLGHMYGDPPDAAARELLRVTRPGGRLGFTAWTPTGAYPSMAGVAMSALAPEDRPSFSAPPFLWGDPGTVRDRLGGAVENLEFETASVRYPALSPAHFWEHVAANSGPFIEVLDAVPADATSDLRSRMIGAIEPYFDDRSNAVELEYRLVTADVVGDG